LGEVLVLRDIESRGDGPHSPPPLLFLVFGASGDLTHRKLLPALYELHRKGDLHPKTKIIGIARKEKTTQMFRKEAVDGIRAFSRHLPEDEKDEPDDLRDFLERIHYFPLSFEKSEDFDHLAEYLTDPGILEATNGNILFYLATPPSFFIPIVEQIGRIRPRLDSFPKAGFRRLVVEKPFGHDLVSAKALNVAVLKVFRESEVHRIDHYLGKETVQNILILRLANPVFGALWSREIISCVEIRVFETIGIEGRGAYFEESGILRDMVQNHLFQLLTLTAMEPPVSFDADSIRDEKVKVLRALVPWRSQKPSESVLFGQYSEGGVLGDPVMGYRQEKGVDPLSVVETYAAMKLEIQNMRWAGVPFHLVAGKRMSRKATEIVLHYRKPPVALFRLAGCHDDTENVLTLSIQPNEGISLRFGIKRPGSPLRIDQADLAFAYSQIYPEDPPEAYSRLIYDVMKGDATLFARNDEVEKAWMFMEPFLSLKRDPMFYPAGSDGPFEVDDFFSVDLS
jgi:glucose-6-phosphate 1-dehydrogenase